MSPLIAMCVYPVLRSLPSNQNGIVYASLKAIRVSDKKVQTIGRQYLTHLLEYENFDFKNSTGVVTIIDTDDKGVKLGKYQILNAKVIKSLIQKDEPTIQQKTKHFCDLNANGDVSYGECTNCMFDSCLASLDCAIQCMFYNLVNRGCSAGIAVSCIYLAAVY